MIDVKPENVIIDLDELDLEYAKGIKAINEFAKAGRAALRQKIADRRMKLKRLLDVLNSQPPIKEPADAEE